MENRKFIPNLKIEGGRMIYRNFSGRKDQYNAAGNRNFGVCVDDEMAENLKADGWRVKYLRARPDDPEQHQQAWLPVKVNMDGQRPPIVYLITSRGKLQLDADTIGQLDVVRVRNADMVIRPYIYPATPTRDSGVAAYLRALYVTIEEDDLELKYGDIPDIDSADGVPF